MKIWKNNDGYFSTDTKTNNYNNYELVNHISFVDCPGHHELFTTLLTSLCLMDGVIIIIAINDPISRKQQLTHQLMAIKLLEIKKIIVCLNKIDLVSKTIANSRKKEIEQFLSKYDIKPLIIIPTSFSKKIGIDYLLYYIENIFNCKKINSTNEDLLFLISRSFDVNKPGTNWQNVCGGVVGGTLISGKLSIDDNIYITSSINKVKNILNSGVKSLKSETTNLNNVISGGLIGIGTDIDPFYCKDDRLKGSIISSKPFELYDKLKLKILKDDYFDWQPIINLKILLLIGPKCCNGIIENINNDIIALHILTGEIPMPIKEKTILWLGFPGSVSVSI
jgi:translation initiation factor 2 subunit 3